MLQKRKEKKTSLNNTSRLLNAHHSLQNKSTPKRPLILIIIILFPVKSPYVFFNH